MDMPVVGTAYKPPRTRWDQIPKMLREQDIDVLVALSPENVTYTSGHYDWCLPIIRDRFSATLIPAGGKPIYLIEGKLEAVARKWSWITDMVKYRENEDSPIRVLAETLKSKGFATGTIAVEMEFLTAGFMEELREYLPKTRFIDGSVILARARAVKTDEEVVFLEAAVKATETAHWKTYQTIKPGDTEVVIARRLLAQMLLEGADFVLHRGLSTGINTMEGHHVPDETPIRPGDVVIVDSGGCFNGYMSDMSRQLVVGKPSPRQRSKWTQLRDLHREAIQCLKVGVRAGAAFDHLRRQERNKDVWFYGHGIGVFVHDPPMLTPYAENGLRTTTNIGSSWELEPNMLVWVEFALSDYEKGQKFHLEDMILITKQGPRILSNVFDTTEMFVVE